MFPRMKPWYQRVQLKPIEGEPGRWKWRISHVNGPRRDVREGTLTVDAQGRTLPHDPGHITAVLALRAALRHGPVEEVDLYTDLQPVDPNTEPVVPVTRRGSREYNARFTLGTLGEQAARRRALEEREGA